MVRIHHPIVNSNTTAVDLLFRCCSADVVSGFHLGTHKFDLVKCEVSGTAQWLFSLKWLPGSGTLGVQLRNGHNIGGIMQITLSMTTNQLSVLGEGDVTFNDSCTLNRSHFVGTIGMFRQLHASSTMSNRPVGMMKCGHFFGTSFCEWDKGTANLFVSDHFEINLRGVEGA